MLVKICHSPLSVPQTKPSTNNTVHSDIPDRNLLIWKNKTEIPKQISKTLQQSINTVDMHPRYGEYTLLRSALT